TSEPQEKPPALRAPSTYPPGETTHRTPSGLVGPIGRNADRERGGASAGAPAKAHILLHASTGRTFTALKRLFYRPPNLCAISHGFPGLLAPARPERSGLLETSTHVSVHCALRSETPRCVRVTGFGASDTSADALNGRCFGVSVRSRLRS